MRFVSQTQVESLKLIGIKWLTLPKKEDIKAIHQLMIEDLKQRNGRPFEKIHFTLSMILKHLLIARIFRKMMLKTYYKGPELGLNILFVGIHKELIDAYDKQIDVARKMINQI